MADFAAMVTVPFDESARRRRKCESARSRCKRVEWFAGRAVSGKNYSLLLKAPLQIGCRRRAREEEEG